MPLTKGSTGNRAKLPASLRHQVNRLAEKLSFEDECNLARLIKIGAEAAIPLAEHYSPDSDFCLDECDITLYKNKVRLGKKAKDKLVCANLPFVLKISGSYSSSPGVSREDLVQEGICGMVTAAERFDPDLGKRFSTYAGIWIRQAMLKAIYDGARTIRAPIYLWAWNSKFTKAMTDAANTGKSCEPEDIRKAIGMSEQVYEFYLLAFREVKSSTALDKYGYQDKIASGLSPSEMPEDYIWRTHVFSTLQELAEKSAEIHPNWPNLLSLRLGLSGAEPMTFAQMARTLENMAPWEARRQYNEAIAWIRSQLGTQLVA